MTQLPLPSSKTLIVTTNDANSLNEFSVLLRSKDASDPIWSQVLIESVESNHIRILFSLLAHAETTHGGKLVDPFLGIFPAKTSTNHQVASWLIELVSKMNEEMELDIVHSPIDNIVFKTIEYFFGFYGIEAWSYFSIITLPLSFAQSLPADSYFKSEQETSLFLHFKTRSREDIYNWFNSTITKHEQPTVIGRAEQELFGSLINTIGISNDIWTNVIITYLSENNVNKVIANAEPFILTSDRLITRDILSFSAINTTGRDFFKNLNKLCPSCDLEYKIKNYTSTRLIDLF
jgi:hypothetical protein